MSVNLLGAYTFNGGFDIELYYTTMFNKIPSIYQFNVNSDKLYLDSQEVKFDFVKDLFPDVVNVRTFYNYEIEDDDVKEEETDFEVFSFDDFDGDGGRSLTILTSNKIVFITYKCVKVLYDAELESIESIEELAKTCFSKFPKNTPKDKTARVGLIKISNNEYYTSFSDIEKTTINIEENYNDDFLSVYDDIVEFLNQRKSGLILCYGAAGSGKTSIIRHLCSNIAKDYVIVPNSVASRLGDPDFISYITSCKDYVFILEDCEQLLVDRVNNPWNNAITTILNMADGLLSDIVNIKFICTFNAKVDKIDKALLRKGRCFAKYEFKELCKEKVAKLNEKYNLGIKEIKPMTLAEVYNSEKRDYSDKEGEMRKIGF